MSFSDLAGHRRVLELLARAAVRGSLPPSLIFAGPEGVGKRAAATALAQLFNCLDRQPESAEEEGAEAPGRARRGPRAGVPDARTLRVGVGRSGAGLVGPRERPSRGSGQSPDE